MTTENIKYIGKDQDWGAINGGECGVAQTRYWYETERGQFAVVETKNQDKFFLDADGNVINPGDHDNLTNWINQNCVVTDEMRDIEKN